MTDSQIASGLGGAGVTEHSFNRRVSGEVALFRERIMEALESFKYVILSDDPLHAKRDGSFSMNVLNCGLKLVVTFRQSSPVSTIAAFNYTIPLSLVTDGDLQTVEREADALIALASRRRSATVCEMCGTNNTGDSRFCRRCGAPNVGSLPAELEVMRLTAGARAGQQTIVTGLLIILSFLALALPLIIFGNAKRETVGWVLLILGQVTGWATLLYGTFRLHRTLNPTPSDQSFTLRDVSNTISNVKPAALPPQSAWSSITEGTTELLDSQPGKPTPTPVEQTIVNTGSMK